MGTTETELRQDRRLQWEGGYNVRDVGGYETEDGRRVRWGVLLRSDNLAHLTPRGREALVEHGVRTIIDLRRSSELQAAPSPFGPEGEPREGVNFLHLPFFEDDDDPFTTVRPDSDTREYYHIMVDESREHVAAIMRAIADAPEGAVLVHCYAGKDRTGIIIALALALARVPEETIAADYALSDTHLQDLYRQWRVDRGEDPDAVNQELQCPPETMRSLLAYIDEQYGGVEQYLLGLGLSHGEIERIRRRLLG